MFLLKGFIDFLKVYVRKPRFLAMIGVLISCVLIMEAVYGQRTVTNIPIYVVDLDNSSVSRTIRTFLESSPDLHVLGAIDTPEKAEEAFFNGDAAAIVLIPDGLSQDVKRQEGGHVFAYIDGTSIIMARNADKAIQTVVKTTSVGVSMITLNKQGVPDFALMGALQPINFDVDRPFNAMTIYSDYLLPVLAFFCLNIFICIMTCAAFQEELPDPIEAHKIRRRFFYFGRLCAVFLIAFIGGGLLYQYGLPRVDIVLQSTPLMAISALVVYIILTEAMFANINLVLPTNFGMSVSFLLCMLSVMLSGLTWPIEMMPWYIQELVTWIPLTPFLQAVQVFLYHDANWSDLSSFGVMFLKQAILWLCMAFIIMRAKDIKLFAVWCWHRIHPKAVVAVTPDGVPVVIDPDSATAPDFESNSTNAPESELNSENAPEPESDSTSIPEPDSATAPDSELDSENAPDLESDSINTLELESDSINTPDLESDSINTLELESDSINTPDLESDSTSIPEPDSATAPDSESNSTNAPESELNSENAPEHESDSINTPDLESCSINTPELESDSTSIPEPEPDSATDPSEAPSKEAQR